MDTERETHTSTVDEAKNKSPKTGIGGASTIYDASKISLVAQLKRKDSFGKPLSAIPSSTRGRYQPIADDDKSLRPLTGRDEPKDNPSIGDIDKENAPGEKSTEDSTNHGAPTPTVRDVPPQNLPKPPVAGLATKNAAPEADSKKTAEGGVKRDSLVATITVVTNLMKWQMKSKKQAGAKLKSMEKYKGHLEVIQRRSRQEQVDIPFPIRLSVRREILPIIHNIAKEYRLSLGEDHKLTREAIIKEEQLKSELAGEGIFL